MQTKSVRLDVDLIKELSEKRIGFESPNDCVKRLLKNNPCGVSNPDETKQAVTNDNDF